MSQLVGQATPGWPVAATDERISAVFYFDDLRWTPVDDLETSTFANSYWPGSAGLLGAYSGDGPLLTPVWFNPPETTRGRNSRYGVVGVTRDEYGSVLGGCTVRLFRTSDNLLVDTTLSDALSGRYLASTPYYPDAHYLVVYKTGVPDRYGTSPNTLIAG